MDYSILFNVVLLLFVLMLLSAIVIIPIKFTFACIRSITRATVKTIEVFVPAKR